MMILYAIARYLGVAGCAVVALLVYYEGLPIVSKIPYIHVIPLIGNLALARSSAMPPNRYDYAGRPRRQG